MEIGAYLCFSGIVWILGLAFVAQARKRIRVYTALSLFLTLSALILFYLFSTWTGLIRANVVTSLDIPRDYVARGAVGLTILLVAILGLFSPAIAVCIVSRRPTNSTPTTR